MNELVIFVAGLGLGYLAGDWLKTAEHEADIEALRAEHVADREAEAADFGHKISELERRLNQIDRDPADWWKPE